MSKDDITLGENTNVRLGVVISIAVAVLTLAGSLLAAVWWASAVQADLNSIKLLMSRLTTVDALTLRVQTLEQYGTEKARELEKLHNQLRKDFDLHVATTTNEKKP